MDAKEATTKNKKKKRKKGCVCRENGALSSSQTA